MTRDEADELVSWIVNPDAQTDIRQSDWLEDDSWFVRVYDRERGAVEDVTDPDKKNLASWMCEF